MRRQIFLTLILVESGRSYAAARGFSPSDDDSGIKNVRFNNLTPITPPAANTAGLQASLDRVARTALKGSGQQQPWKRTGWRTCGKPFA